MENFPASDFMTDFEIAEIDNEMYENNRRRLLNLAEQQRQAREAEELELNRQEGERFLIQAAEEAQNERIDIEATIADIHNNIFVQNFVANSFSYRYMGVVPLLTITSPSSPSSSVGSNDYEYDNITDESGFPNNNEESGLPLNDEESNYLEPQHRSNNHSQLQNGNNNTTSTNQQSQEDINHQNASVRILIQTISSENVE